MAGNLSEAIQDIIQGARMAPLWLSMGWDQTLARVRRTILGPFWLAANFLVIAFSMAYVFGGLASGGAHALLPKLMAGLLTWGLIGGAIGDSAGVFISAGPMMTSQRMPLSFHIYLMIWKGFINFLAQLLALWAIFLLMRFGALPAWPILIGLPLIMLNSFFFSLILGLPSTRFRDVNQLTGFAVQILFFITPVFWDPAQMRPQYRFILDYNPFAHYIELVREPLLGRMPHLVHYEWTIGSILVLGVTAVTVLALYRKRVIFWL
jgi:ABC-type polysaccharide/polyol phosphate export permease